MRFIRFFGVNEREKCEITIGDLQRTDTGVEDAKQKLCVNMMTSKYWVA
jgi:hypothetical protein